MALHLLRPVTIAVPVELHVETLRRGRRTEVLRVTLTQEAEPVAHAVVVGQPGPVGPSRGSTTSGRSTRVVNDGWADVDGTPAAVYSGSYGNGVASDDPWVEAARHTGLSDGQRSAAFVRAGPELMATSMSQVTFVPADGPSKPRSVSAAKQGGG